MHRTLPFYKGLQTATFDSLSLSYMNDTTPGYTNIETLLCNLFKSFVTCCQPAMCFHTNSLTIFDLLQEGKDRKTY